MHKKVFIIGGLVAAVMGGGASAVSYGLKSDSDLTCYHLAAKWVHDKDLGSRVRAAVSDNKFSVGECQDLQNDIHNIVGVRHDNEEAEQKAEYLSEVKGTK
jgi:hypothetical protein